MKLFFQYQELVLVLLILGCSNAKNYKEFAKEQCNCMQPLADWNQKFQKAQQENNRDDLTKMLEELESISIKSEECALDLEEKFGIVGEEEKINKEVKKICPEVAEIIDRARKMKVEE